MDTFYLSTVNTIGVTGSSSHQFLKRFSIPFIVLFFIHLTAFNVFGLDSAVLDAFDSEMESSLEDENPLTVEGTMIGRVRGLNLIGTPSNFTVTEDESGVLTFDGSAEPTGILQLLWDRTGETFDPVNPEGLGPTNFKENDLGDEVYDAFKLILNSVGSAGDITLNVYSGEEEDVHSSQFVINQLASPSPVEVIIPYASFLILEGSGADFASIGAMMMELTGGLVAEIDQLGVMSIISGVEKTDSLQIDNNSNSQADPGDTLRYTITVPGNAAVAASFTDTPDEDTQLVVSSVTTSQGAVTTGNTAGDTGVVVNMGPLPVGGVVTITFDVLVEDPFDGMDTVVCNQGEVFGTGLISAMTDDPDIDVSFPDQTCTTIFIDETAPVFDEPFPADLVINNGDSTDPADTGSPTATDNVTATPNILITYSDNTVNGPGLFQTRIDRVWKAEDEAGNSTARTQKIEIKDIVIRALVVDQPVYGLFNPNSDPGNRQLGTIELSGDITLLGTDSSIEGGNISTSSNITAYNMSDAVFYFIGQTESDSLSKIFTVDVSTGIATSAQILSEGTYNTVVGIWFDDETDVLYGLIDPSASPGSRRLATIDPTNGTVTYLAGSIAAPLGTIGGVVAGSSNQGAFYFLGSPGGIPGAIYTVDTTTGTATSAALVGVNYNAIASLEYDEFESVLYGLIFEGAERRLVTIDPTDGTITILGTTTIGGGGVSITTYQGVSTLNPFDNQFLFVGRYNPGTGNKWAHFGVDTATGDTTYNTIDVTDVNSGFYYGLQYAINTGRIEIKKALIPVSDSGVFNLQLDSVTRVANVGDGGTTGEITLQTGNYDVGEAGGAGTDLSHYVASMECRDNNGVGSIVANGTPPQNVNIGTDDDIVCVISNNLDIGTLEVVKILVPNSDLGRFDLQVDGNTEASGVGDGGTTGELILHTGTYSVGEIAAGGTDLSHYIANVECKDEGGTGSMIASGTPPVNITIAAADNIVCTVTNTLDVGKLEVVKSLSPISDSGLFDLLMAGIVKAADVGHGGSTGELTVHVGSISVGEAAGTGTDLANYVSNIECRDGNGSGSIKASGTPPVDVSVGVNDDIVCIITNTLKDTDGDGIDDSWEIFYFGDLTTANEATDFDRDGYSDLQEFINHKNGEKDPKGNIYDPTVRSAPGGTGYIMSHFWILMIPAITHGSQ